MSKRPVMLGLVVVTLVCLGIAAIDFFQIVARPLMPIVEWMYP